MTLNTHPTYYDVLDVKPDASPHEIREAYLRIKATYNKDSAALYTLIGPDERESMIRLIEDAYEVLSHPEKRKEYDRKYGFLSSEMELTEQSRPPTSKIISIDRVPPMDQAASDDLLIAPSTDFSVQSPPPMARQQQPNATMLNPFTESPAPVPPSAPMSPMPPMAPMTPAGQKAREQETALEREIGSETEWSGSFIRRVRETRRISLEELSSSTKISKMYLIAIEEENFAKLPATVFVRGFLTQIARLLKLPADRVVTAYLARLNQFSAKHAR